MVQGIQAGTVDLTAPATTVALLKLDAVVGLKGTVETINGTDTLTRVGVTCALCHSTVDDSFAPGIGKRLDGWPNRDSTRARSSLCRPRSIRPRRPSTTRGARASTTRASTDGINGTQAIPPAFGLRGINRIPSTGDGDDIAYWNRYVAVTQWAGTALIQRAQALGLSPVQIGDLADYLKSL